jgi:hypothetical protein
VNRCADIYYSSEKIILCPSIRESKSSYIQDG